MKLSSAAYSFDPDKTTIAKYLKEFSILCVSTLAAFFFFNLFAQFYLAAWIDLLGIILYLSGLIIYRSTGNVYVAGSTFILTCCLVLFFQSIILEVDAIHNMFFFPIVGACCFAISDSKRFTVSCFVLTCASAVAAYLVPKYFNTTSWIMDPEQKIVYMIASILTSLAMTFKVGSIIYRQKQMAFARLNAANRRLEEMNQKNRGLLQLIIHDVSNPLLSIDFAMKYAVRAGSEHPALTRMTSICDPAILTIREIIESAREMMALEDGKIISICKPVEIRRLITETVLLYEHNAHKKGILIESEFKVPKDTEVLVDPKSFKSSVISNLISNAIKFSHRNTTVKIETSEENEQIVLKIIDTGVGMPVKIQENIFSPQARTTRPGTAGEPGVGYGMPLAKAFMDSYGGTIECISEEGIGTLVKLTLKKAKSTVNA